MKTNIYIYQLCGIILLLLGYLFSNTPDSLSEMYFNPNPVHQSVISKHNKTLANYEAPAKVCSKSDPRHKSNVPKHISFEPIMPFFYGHSDVCSQPAVRVDHSCALGREYSYLYYSEINPPPPKAVTAC